MAGQGGPDKKDGEKKDLFEPTGELKGGYDMGMARAYALDHAKQHAGEYVGKGKERRPLLWEVDQSRFDEDAECFEIVLACQPEGAQVQQKGIWVYHVRSMGGLMPGTPLLRQSLQYTLPRAPRRRSRVLLVLVVAVALVGGGLAAAAAVAPGFGRSVRALFPATSPTATPPPTPLPTPTLAVAPTATPQPPPTARPALPPTSTPARPTPLPTPVTLRLPKLGLSDPQIIGLKVTVNGAVSPGVQSTIVTRLRWDWGDGTVQDSFFPASHTYTKSGTYTVTVTAYQNDGLTATTSIVVTVSSPATPTATPSPAPAGPKFGGIIRIPQGSDPPTWDPSKNAGEPLTATRYLVFSKLATQWSTPAQNCQGSIYPLALTQWSASADGLTWTLGLRKGMMFHNGREVNAKDLMVAFQRYQKGPTPMASRSAIVQSVAALDAYTIQMKLSAPWGGFAPELLAYRSGPWLEPAEAGGPGWPWEDPGKSWVGSGPFTFAGYEKGVKWTLKRNPSYWVKGRPYLDGVEFLVMPDANTRLAALKAGKVSLVRQLPEGLTDEATKTVPGIQVVRCPGSSMPGAGVLWMNTTGPPFNDVRVRRAVALAIDRDSLIKGPYGGRATYVNVLPPKTQYAMSFDQFPPDVQSYLKYNPALVKQLLAEAGYPNGLKTTLNFTAQFGDQAIGVAKMLADYLGKVGIQANLVLLEPAVYSDRVGSAKYAVGEMALGTSVAATPEDPQALPVFWSKAGTNNRSLANDPIYDSFFEKFRSTLDEATRKDLAYKLQARAAELAWAVFLPLADSTMTGLPNLHFNWVGNTLDYSMLLETAWIE